LDDAVPLIISPRAMIAAMILTYIIEKVQMKVKLLNQQDFAISPIIEGTDDAKRGLGKKNELDEYL
jgi:hypothetical protein